MRNPAIGATLQPPAGQPDHVLQIAWRAQHRLHRVHHRMRARGKPGNVATVAVARELAGFLWAAATGRITSPTPSRRCRGAGPPPARATSL